MESVDYETGIVTFTTPAPVNLARIHYIWLDKYDTFEDGSVNEANPHEFKVNRPDETTFPYLVPGKTVGTDLRVPYTSIFTSPPNQALEAWTLEDGAIERIRTYQYGRHGLISVTRETDDGHIAILYCAEYDQDGTLLSESSYCGDNFATTYHFTYDEQGRLVRASSDTSDITLAWQETENATTLALTADGSNGYQLTVNFYPQQHRLEFTSLDLTGVNPMPPEDLGLAFDQLGITLPNAIGAAGIYWYGSATLTLDEQQRVISATGTPARASWTEEITINYDEDGRWRSITTTSHVLLPDGPPLSTTYTRIITTTDGH